MRSFLIGALKFIGGLFFVLLFLWVAGIFSFLVKATSMQPQAPHAKTEAIVVLTGGHDRVNTGLALWSEGLAPELFISGVHPKISRADIFEMWDGDVKALPFCCITLGYKARSTLENATEVHDWIEDNHIRTVRLVTSDYHMPRARLELTQTLPGTKFYYHSVPETQLRWGSSYFRYVLFEEYHKYLWRNFQIITGYKGEPWKLL